MIKTQIQKVVIKLKKSKLCKTENYDLDTLKIRFKLFK